MPAFVLAVVLTGCAEEADSESSGRTAPTSAFNDADVEFVLAGGAYATRAVTAARMVTERGRDAQVRSLANDVVDAQGADSTAISAWVLEWGEEGADLGHDVVPHDSDLLAQDGLDDDRIAAMRTASGAPLDALFLKGLRVHLRAGTTLWQQQIEQGHHAGAVGLATDALARGEQQLTKVRELLRDPGS